MIGSISINVTNADFAGAEWTLKEVLSRTGKSMRDAVRTGARITCNAFGPGEQGQAATWPKTWESGAGAVVTQVRRAYHTPGSVCELIKRTNKGMGAAFWRAYKKSDDREMIRLMAATPATASIRAEAWDDGSEHRRLHRQNKRGRIPAKTKPKVMVSRIDLLQKYEKRQMDKVGFTQRGFYVCARDPIVNAKNEVTKDTAPGLPEETYKPWPKWIITPKGKPKHANGKVTESGSEWFYKISIRNSTPWASEVMADGAIAFIQGVARRRMKQWLEVTLKKSKYTRKFSNVRAA